MTTVPPIARVARQPLKEDAPGDFAKYLRGLAKQDEFAWAYDENGSSTNDIVEAHLAENRILESLQPLKNPTGKHNNTT